MICVTLDLCEIGCVLFAVCSLRGCVKDRISLLCATELKLYYGSDKGMLDRFWQVLMHGMFTVAMEVHVSVGW